MHAYSDLDDDDVAGAAEEVAGPLVHLRLNTSFAQAGSGCSPPASRARGTRTRATAGTRNRRQNAVQAFYFANRFHDHLAAAPINFTDGSFDGGSDPLELQTDDGAKTLKPA